MRTLADEFERLREVGPKLADDLAKNADFCRAMFFFGAVSTLELLRQSSPEGPKLVPILEALARLTEEVDAWATKTTPIH